MNYYEVLEIKDEGQPTGKFRMTGTNNKVTVAVGYCAEKHCFHETRKEAWDCWIKYLDEKHNSNFPGGYPITDKERAYDGTTILMIS